MNKPQTPPEKPRSEFLTAVRNGMLLGGAALLIAIPWMRSQDAPRPQPPAAQQAARTAPSQPPVVTGRLPEFGSHVPSDDVRHVANWAFFTGNNEGKSVVILDKKHAQVYTFDPAGKLVATTPALLGAAIGDEAAPGIGDKPLDQIQQHEKTTHAGRFVAQPGMNTLGEDVVWVDYENAISMHRVRPTNPAERRLERLASDTHADNRISFGCVNLPVDFYEGVLSPTVKKTGAVIYVLPETRTPQEVFASWDVTDPSARPPAQQFAQATHAAADTAAPPQARANRDR